MAFRVGEARFRAVAKPDLGADSWVVIVYSDLGEGRDDSEVPVGRFTVYDAMTDGLAIRDFVIKQLASKLSVVRWEERR